MGRALSGLCVLAMLGACDWSEGSDTGASGDTLMQEVEALLPAWDREHLTAPLDVALSACSVDDLTAAVEILACHELTDLAEHCPDDEDCYAELSEECAAIGTLSEACVDGYHAHLRPDDRLEKVIQPTDCDASQESIHLATAAYEPDDDAVSTYLAEHLPDLTLEARLTGGEAGGQAILASASQRRAWLPWSYLLWRTFGALGWHCPRCDKRMRRRAVVLHPPATTRILVGLAEAARAPPTSSALAG